LPYDLLKLRGIALQLNFAEEKKILMFITRSCGRENNEWLTL
jgi:hypothetical protein